MSKYNVYVEDVSVEAVFNKLGGIQGARALLRGELVVQLAVIPEPTLDFIVRVDRSVKPTYPDWMKKVMNPELELAGPTEYDLSKVEQCLHDDQKTGYISGNTIYKYLQKGDAFANCLNLQDGLAIQQKGIAVFRTLFANKVVFLWGSVVQYRCGSLRGSLRVPCLYNFGDEVGLSWRWLGHSWNSSTPALRFNK